jgi:hypothetical protein
MRHAVRGAWTAGAGTRTARPAGRVAVRNMEVDRPVSSRVSFVASGRRRALRPRRI